MERATIQWYAPYGRNVRFVLDGRWHDFSGARVHSNQMTNLRRLCSLLSTAVLLDSGNLRIGLGPEPQSGHAPPEALEFDFTPYDHINFFRHPHELLTLSTFGPKAARVMHAVRALLTHASYWGDAYPALDQLIESLAAKMLRGHI